MFNSEEIQKAILAESKKRHEDNARPKTKARRVRKNDKPRVSSVSEAEEAKEA